MIAARSMALVALLCGMPAGASRSVELPSPRTGPEVDSLRTLARTAGEAMWPGFGTAPFGFLVLESSREVLLCRPQIPSGFTDLGTESATGCQAAERPRGKLPATMLAAMPLFGPPWTIVMGPPPAEPEKLPRWRSTVLHEHTHQWQAEFPGYYERVKALGLADGDETGMWMLDFPFPYGEPSVADAYGKAAQALVAAVEARNTDALPMRVHNYLQLRRAFAAAAGDRNWRYLEFQLWQEGVSRWTEIALSRRSNEPAMVAAADAYEQEMLDMLRHPDLAEQQRVIVYAYGMAEALLMESCGPEWRAGYPAALALGPLLDKAVAACAGHGPAGSRA